MTGIFEIGQKVRINGGKHRGMIATIKTIDEEMVEVKTGKYTSQFFPKKSLLVVRFRNSVGGRKS